MFNVCVSDGVCENQAEICKLKYVFSCFAFANPSFAILFESQEKLPNLSANN
jgi:hypothetical protein